MATSGLNLSSKNKCFAHVFANFRPAQKCFSLSFFQLLIFIVRFIDPNKSIFDIKNTQNFLIKKKFEVKNFLAEKNI